MEQIQLNCAVSTAAVSQNATGKVGEKSDLFPKILKEQGLSEAPTPIQNKKDGTLSACSETAPDDTAENKDGVLTAENQPQPVLIDWFRPIIQGQTTGFPGMETVFPDVAVQVDGTIENHSAETEGVKVYQSDDGFPAFAGELSVVNGMGKEANETAVDRLTPLLRTVQTIPLTSSPAYVGPAASLPEESNLAQENLFCGNPGQSMAAVSAAVKNSMSGLPSWAVVHQGMSAPGKEEIACKMMLETMPAGVSLLGEPVGNEIKAQTAQTTGVLNATNMSEQPYGTSRTEPLPISPRQPLTNAGIESQNEEPAGTQNTVRFEAAMPLQNKVYAEVATARQNTVSAGVSVQAQNPDQMKTRKQNESADDTGLQNTLHNGIQGQSQSFAQVKTTDQTQSVLRNQLSYQINAHFDQGSNEFEMQLYPKDLGKVNVKMTMENGSLIVEICAASAKTQSIILANADDIKAMLQSQSSQQIQIFVPQDQKPTQQQSFQDEQGGHRNPYSPEDQQSEENEEQREMTTEQFIHALNMFSGKYYPERSQVYAD